MYELLGTQSAHQVASPWISCLPIRQGHGQTLTTPGSYHMGINCIQVEADGALRLHLGGNKETALAERPVYDLSNTRKVRGYRYETNVRTGSGSAKRQMKGQERVVLRSLYSGNHP